MYGAAVACQTWRTWAAAKCNTAVQQVCMAAQQNRVVKFQRRVHLSVLVLNKRTSAPTPLLPQVENSETRRTQLLEAWAAPLRKYAASRTCRHQHKQTNATATPCWQQLTLPQRSSSTAQDLEQPAARTSTVKPSLALARLHQILLLMKLLHLSACTAHWQLVQLLRVSTAGSTCTSTNRAETNPTRYSQTMLAAVDVAATILFNSSGF